MLPLRINAVTETVWNVSSERCRPNMLPYTVIAYIITEYFLFIILMDHFQLHPEQVKKNTQSGSRRKKWYTNQMTGERQPSTQANLKCWRESDNAPIIFDVGARLLSACLFNVHQCSALLESSNMVIFHLRIL